MAIDRRPSVIIDSCRLNFNPPIEAGRNNCDFVSFPGVRNQRTYIRCRISPFVVFCKFRPGAPLSYVTRRRFCTAFSVLIGTGSANRPWIIRFHAKLSKKKVSYLESIFVMIWSDSFWPPESVNFKASGRFSCTFQALLSRCQGFVIFSPEIWLTAILMHFRPLHN